MNDEEELFDGKTPVALHERGESFGISPTCYLRMAKCALRAMEFGGVEPVLIRRLRAAPGCELRLFGTANAYTLRVFADSSPALVGLYFLPLDSHLSGPGCQLAVGYDEPATWHHIASVMIWREGAAGSEELLAWQEISDELREANGWEEGA